MKRSRLSIYLGAGLFALIGIGNAMGDWGLLQVPKEYATLNCSLGVGCVAFAPDAKTLASGNGDKTVTLWNLAPPKITDKLEGHTGPVYSIAFSPDGKTVASGSEDRTIKLWDVASGKNTATLKELTNIVWSLSFSIDGKTLASAGQGKAVIIWDVSTAEIKSVLKGHEKEVICVLHSPDRKTLATSAADSTIKLWDLTTGKTLATLHAYATCLAFSPDGKMLASGSSRGVQLWGLPSGEQLFADIGGYSTVPSSNFWLYRDEPREQPKDVRSVAFSPDGKTLAFAGTSKKVTLWDVASRKEVIALDGHSEVVSSLAFSSDINTLASGSWDKTVKLWQVHPEKKLEK